MGVAPVDQYTQDGEPFPGCPRTFARTMTERLQERGLSVRATYELEFSMGRRDERRRFQPRTRRPGYSDIALVASHDFAFELIDAVEAQGLEPQQFPSRVRRGAVRTLTRSARDPTAAADATMVARQTILVRSPRSRMGHVVRSARGRRHGQRDASASQPLAGRPEPHVWRGRPLRDGTRRRGIHHRDIGVAPGITAIAAPTCASYLRLGNRITRPGNPVFASQEPRGGSPVHRRVAAVDVGALPISRSNPSTAPPTRT